MKKIIPQLHSGVLALLLVVTIIITACNSAESITTPGNPEKNGLIQPSSWVFTASQTIPQFGQPRQEGNMYTVSCNPGKLVAYLPYFGRADGAANTFTDKSPLDFTSLDFAINKQEKKPGEWRINIVPKDYGEVRSMDFIFYDNGNANLDVVLTNRSGISFRGSVQISK